MIARYICDNAPTLDQWLRKAKDMPGRTGLSVLRVEGHRGDGQVLDYSFLINITMILG